VSYVVTNENREPVAVAAELVDAQTYAWRYSGGKLADGGSGALDWSPTGKMLVGGRWNGWEIKPVQEVGYSG
jgi:hypothetical protein